MGLDNEPLFNGSSGNQEGSEDSPPPSYRPQVKPKRLLMLVAASAVILLYVVITTRPLSQLNLYMIGVTPTDNPPKGGPSPYSLTLQIDTPGYKLPRLTPWDASIKPFLGKALDPSKDLACSNGILRLTRSWGNKVFLDGLQDYKGTTCCYSAITRVQESPRNYTKEADSKYRIENECHPLEKPATVVNAHSIYVKCTRGGKLLYKNVHHLVNLQSFKKKVGKWGEMGCDPGSYTSGNGSKAIPKNKISQKSTTLNSDRNQTGNKTEDIKEKKHVLGFAPAEFPADETAGDGLNLPYSVVIFGIDSISRQNLQRYMPRTFDFLKKSGAIDLLGINKVADNTFPNLMPILAGKSASTLQKECLNGSRWNAFDNCSFIWSNFSNNGYLTVYGEDTPIASLFHYKRPGFVKQPTDLYLRPFFLASDKLIGHPGKLKPKTTTNHYCLGSLSSFGVIKQYSLNVADTLGCLPYFGFFWTTKLTHDKNHFASLIDFEALEYLEQIQRSPSFSRTFLFFMSDHGMRFGEIRKTDIGEMEESLPYMFIFAPSDFKRKYPVAFRNMVTNQDRLTSHYDIHSTLRDILREKYRDESYVTKENVISGRFPGLTLFRRIPDTRTCKNAGILPHYCVGLPFQETNVTGEVSQAAAKFVIQKLNEGLKKFPQCHQFVRYMVRRVLTTSTPKNFVRVWLQTIPGKGEMEATLMKTNTSFELTAEVSRVDSYKGQSDCIADDMYRKYCLCK